IDSVKNTVEFFIHSNEPKPIFSLFKDSLSTTASFNQAAGILRRSLKVVDQQTFLVVNFSSNNPLLAQRVNESYLEALEIYYNRQKTAKAESNLIFFTRRADSVNKKLDKVNRSLSYYFDNFQNNIRKFNQLKQKELIARQGMLEQLYISLEISKEQALSQKQQQTEIIQILDPPKPPFQSIKPSAATYAIGGLILGIIIAGIWSVKTLIWEDFSQIIQNSLEANDDGA
ncbi:MAG: hypothetical protein AAGI38_24515, partial [Bacteroidota bacterium]